MSRGVEPIAAPPAAKPAYSYDAVRLKAPRILERLSATAERARRHGGFPAPKNSRTSVHCTMITLDGKSDRLRERATSSGTPPQRAHPTAL